MSSTAKPFRVTDAEVISALEVAAARGSSSVVNQMHTPDDVEPHSQLASETLTDRLYDLWQADRVDSALTVALPNGHEVRAYAPLEDDTDD